MAELNKYITVHGNTINFTISSFVHSKIKWYSSPRIFNENESHFLSISSTQRFLNFSIASLWFDVRNSIIHIAIFQFN